MRRPLHLLLALLVPAIALAEGSPADTLAKAIENPTSTGLLVTEVVPEGQAKSAGILPGDIIVSYAGKPTPEPEALHMAINEAEGDSVAVEVDRGGEKKSFDLKKGKIGIAVAPVKKGERFDPLPPSTDPKLDFSRLEKAGEAWYRFTHDGTNQQAGFARKIGFEHYMWKVEDGNAVLDSEVAFDLGPDGGLNQFVVRVVVAVGPHPQGKTSRFENPLEHFVAEGAVFMDPKAPTAGWETTATGSDGKTQTIRQLGAGDLVPTYFVYCLAKCMPQEKGACCHFTPIDEGTGKIGFASAILVDGSEATTIDGKDVQTARMVWLSMGRVMNRLWVDADGNVLHADYIGEQAFATTKEEALKDLNPEIHPQTAK